MFFCKSSHAGPFRVDGSDLTLTISAACAQKLAGKLWATFPIHLWISYHAARTPTDKSVWGNTCLFVILFWKGHQNTKGRILDTKMSKASRDE